MTTLAGGSSVKSRADRMSFRYKVFRWAMILLFKLVYGYTVEGRENVPRSGPLVIVSNHSQYLDPVFVCMSVPRRIQWMAKKEVFVFPFRRFFRFLGTFPVDRQGGGRAALRSALEYLSSGWALGIFPEGTHKTKVVGSNTRPEPKNGAIMLASRGKSGILPVYISAAPTLSGRLKGEKLRAYVGPLVNIDNTLRGREAYREASEEVLEVVYRLPDKYDDERDPA